MSDSPICYVRLVAEGARVPEYSRRGDAGVDLRCLTPVVIPPASRALIPTGLALQLPAGTVGRVAGRSGLMLRYGVWAFEGVVDGNYRGELKVILVNSTPAEVRLEAGERVAQLLVAPLTGASFVESRDELPATNRGEAGFGSSGTI